MKTPPPESRQPSLRARLLVALMVPLVVLGGASAAWDVVVARGLTDDAYDQALASAAIGLSVRLETDADNDLPEHLDATMRAMARIDSPDTWHYLVLDASGKRLAGDAGLAALATAPATDEPRFSDARIDGVPVRVVSYVFQDQEGAVSVIVAVTGHRRQVAAAGIMSATLWPNLVLLLATMLMVAWSIRMVLRPLTAISHRFARSRAQDLVDIPPGRTPREAMPLLDAVNELMQRLREAALSQQAFLNQTAHQLRTPLAALQTQLELLREASPEHERPRIDPPLASARRLAHLTHQMLALARAEPGAAAVPLRPVDLVALFEEAATAGDDAARQRGVELEFDTAPAEVQGSGWMLHELLANLIDNAIAHAPAGTRVMVRCGVRHEVLGAQPFLEVVDAGPGIPEADHERVFEPFVRLAGGARGGSGLGLAIVRGVAERHGATVSLSPGEHGAGTCARVLFPPAVPAGFEAADDWVHSNVSSLSKEAT